MEDQKNNKKRNVPAKKAISQESTVLKDVLSDIQNHPEIIKVLANNPELAEELKKRYPEFGSVLVKVEEIYKAEIESDDKSVSQYFDILHGNQDNERISRLCNHDTANNIINSINEMKQDASIEERIKLIEKEIEVYQMEQKKDTEIRQHEREISNMADNKDTENKNNNSNRFIRFASILFGAATVYVGIKYGDFSDIFKSK